MSLLILRQDETRRLHLLDLSKIVDDARLVELATPLRQHKTIAACVRAAEDCIIGVHAGLLRKRAFVIQQPWTIFVVQDEGGDLRIVDPALLLPFLSC